jgi:hypothetical protein
MSTFECGIAQTRLSLGIPADATDAKPYRALAELGMRMAARAMAPTSRRGQDITLLWSRPVR